MELNIWAKIIIGFGVFNVITVPFMIGKDRGVWSLGHWAGTVLSLVLILLAFGLKINIQL